MGLNLTRGSKFFSEKGADLGNLKCVVLRCLSSVSVVHVCRIYKVVKLKADSQSGQTHKPLLSPPLNWFILCFRRRGKSIMILTRVHPTFHFCDI